MMIKAGIIIIPNEYVIGLAALKIYKANGYLGAAIYGLFIGSYGLGFSIEYDT